MEARFRYVGEIIESVESWLRGNEEKFSTFLDNLELDLSVNQNLPNGSQSQETSYLIHSSWTFSTTVAELHSALSMQVISWLDEDLQVNCSLFEFKNWLGNRCKALREVVTQFYIGQSFAHAIAHYIAMDILLANMLTGIYKVRLNAGLLQHI